MNQNPNFSIRFDTAKGYIHVQFVGVINIQTIESALEQLIGSPEYVPGTPAIYEISMADISGIDSDMAQALSGSIVRITSGRIGKPRVALLSKNDLNFSMAQLFKEYYQDGVTAMGVFGSLQEAEAWLFSD